MRIQLITVLAGVACLLLAGCSGGGLPGTPSGTSSPATGSGDASGASGSAGGSSSAQGAPKVQNPIDESTFSAKFAKPCSLLSVAQLAKVHITNAPSPGPSSDKLGSGCDWTSEDTEDSLYVTSNATHNLGLSDVYGKRAGSKYFIPTTVASYPAVFWDPSNDERSQGTCSITVGVNDHQDFSVGYDASLTSNASWKSQSCQLAEQTAAEVITSLGGR